MGVSRSCRIQHCAGVHRLLWVCVRVHPHSRVRALPTHSTKASSRMSHTFLTHQHATRGQGPAGGRRRPGDGPVRHRHHGVRHHGPAPGGRRRPGRDQPGHGTADLRLRRGCGGGRAGDHGDRRACSAQTMVLWLMAFFTIANVSSVVAPDYEWMLLTRFLSGLPHGAYFGLAAILAGSLVPATMRGSAIAWVMLGLSIANVLGVPVVTWMGQQLGWRWMFAVVGLVGALTWISIKLFVPLEPGPRRGQHPAGAHRTAQWSGVVGRAHRHRGLRGILRRLHVHQSDADGRDGSSPRLRPGGPGAVRRGHGDRQPPGRAPGRLVGARQHLHRHERDGGLHDHVRSASRRTRFRP